MAIFSLNWLCMDCKCEFSGYVDEDGDLILCPVCDKEFIAFVDESEERSYSLYWWKEFIKVYGNRKERKERYLERLIDDALR
ncbi:hypothetical protein JCM15519_22480 [Fundidesulfovibrio butyratiphilus]